MNSILILMAAVAMAPEGSPPPESSQVRTWSICTGEPPPERFYPPRAMRLGIEGMAYIQCRVAPSGDVKACSLISEPAPDLGFGEAALRIGCQFKFKPPADGRPFISNPVPVRFKLPN